MICSALPLTNFWLSGTSDGPKVLPPALYVAIAAYREVLSLPSALDLFYHDTIPSLSTVHVTLAYVSHSENPQAAAVLSHLSQQAVVQICSQLHSSAVAQRGQPVLDHCSPRLFTWKVDQNPLL